MGTLLFTTLFLALSTPTSASNIPQVLLVNQPHEMIVQTLQTTSSFNTLQSTGTDKRNIVAITLVCVAFLVFGTGMTLVLCCRHNKVLCFAPPKTATPTTPAAMAIDASVPDAAPDSAILSRRQSQLRYEEEQQLLSDLHRVPSGIELQQTGTAPTPNVIMA